MRRNKEDERRAAHNREVVRKMRTGESLSTRSLEDTAFPPRPTIQKDLEAMRKLYKLPVIPLRDIKKTT